MGEWGKGREHVSVNEGAEEVLSQNILSEIKVEYVLDTDDVVLEWFCLFTA